MFGFRQKAVRIALAAFIVLALAAPASAREFEKPTVDTLVKALIRFGALNIREEEALNDYAMGVECKLYDYFFHDDFRWHEVQAAMRKSIKQNVELFPTGFYYDSAMRLSRYDFKDGLFRFELENKQSIANTFSVSVPDDQMTCKGEKMRYLPMEYRFVLDQPVRMTGIPLTESDANQLIKRMEERGNTKRIVFARFNLRVVYIMPLSRQKDEAGRLIGRYRQNISQSYVRLDSRLDSIDYYEDMEMTKLIYSYRQ